MQKHGRSQAAKYEDSILEHFENLSRLSHPIGRPHISFADSPITYE